MKPSPRPRLPIFVLGAFFLAVGCNNSSTTPPTNDLVVAAVHLTGVSQPLLIGANARLTAVVVNPAGETLSSPVTWSSSNSAVATVTADGTVAALSVGSTVISAGIDTASGSVTVTVNNPAPTITSISPTSVMTGGADQILTVTGSGFLATSMVQWNGAALTTTFGSSTRLIAVLPAADIAVATMAAVTVVNPAPGGGASAGQSFTVSSSSMASWPSAAGAR